ncbi:MAG: Thiol-disulfide oxidoreductase ResA [Planctomycetota bacterium]
MAELLGKGLIRRFVGSLTAAVLISPAMAKAQDAAVLLKDYKPTLSIAAEYDTPATAQDLAACKLEKVSNPNGYAIRDGQGRLLRKFVDSNGSGRVNQWSYYQDGFEVYREIDIDAQRGVDEARWLNAGGARIAEVKSSKVTGWKRLSAEESSKVLVQAIVKNDMALLETVMVLPEEISSLGLTPDAVKSLSANSTNRSDELKKLTGQLVGWNESTNWLRFDGHMPHMIPADAANLKSDILTYENGVVFVASGNQSDPTKTSYLQVPEMVKIGDVWKFVNLPRAINPGSNEPALGNDLETVRAVVYRNAPNGAGMNANPALETALKALADYDAANSAALTSGNRQEAARYHVSRVPVLKAVMQAASDTDKIIYLKQIVDSLTAAAQTGQYNDGFKVLDQLAKDDPSIASYVAFRKIAAEFALANEEPGANLIKVQRDWLGNLEQFLKDFPKSDEAPEALLQLASINEFNADEDKAKTYYGRLAADFPDSEFGKKAAGAMRRLDIIGKPLPITGKTIKGQTVDLSQGTGGKSVAVVFWASWAEPARKDLAELAKLASTRANDFEVVTISLDNSAEDLQNFLKSNPVNLPIIFETGGMDGRLAQEMGIISLPTVFLIDSSGKVSNRLVRTAAEIAKQLDRDEAPKTGVASGIGADASRR